MLYAPGQSVCDMVDFIWILSINIVDAYISYVCSRNILRQLCVLRTVQCYAYHKKMCASGKDGRRCLASVAAIAISYLQRTTQIKHNIDLALMLTIKFAQAKIHIYERL